MPLAARSRAARPLHRSLHSWWPRSTTACLPPPHRRRRNIDLHALLFVFPSRVRLIVSRLTEHQSNTGRNQLYTTFSRVDLVLHSRLRLESSTRAQPPQPLNNKDKIWCRTRYWWNELFYPKPYAKKRNFESETLWWAWPHRQTLALPQHVGHKFVKRMQGVVFQTGPPVEPGDQES